MLIFAVFSLWELNFLQFNSFSIKLFLEVFVFLSLIEKFNLFEEEVLLWNTAKFSIFDRDRTDILLITLLIFLIRTDLETGLYLLLFLIISLLLEEVALGLE